MKYFYLLAISLISVSLFANDKLEHKIPVGEGAALPSTNINLLLQDNPTGIAYSSGHQIGLGYFKNDSGNRSDINYTYGGGDWGLALDYHTDDPDDNSGASSFQAMGVGFDLGSFALGFSSYQNANSDTSDLLNFNSIGLQFNPGGSHRIGAVAYNFANNSTSSKEYSVGYAYIDSKFALILDYVSYKDDRSITTPGFVYFNNQFQFSISQRAWKDGGANDEDGTKVAIGFSAGDFQINLYKGFVLDSGISVSTVF
jgi:hypothetical protein